MEEKDSSDSLKWNVAQGFTQMKILIPLVEMDKLVKIALYGTEDISESLLTDEQIKVQLRIEAIKRFVTCLEILIENTDFACNKKEKETLELLSDDIKMVKKYIRGITFETLDQRNGLRRLEINEEHFSLCLNKLRNIKKRMPDPLNVSSLIFPQTEGMSVEDIKKKFIQRSEIK